ncbi:unnamed protein product [Lactuca virosa]|uniref:Uncharacterized protein n=1 Tax=Lactuca virosa TaxID=75947 RepID=A0AAU9LLS0_9ASTR|nr:unnamed protein product [Lactuca virosa]
MLLTGGFMPYLPNYIFNFFGFRCLPCGIPVLQFWIVPSSASSLVETGFLGCDSVDKYGVFDFGFFLFVAYYTPRHSCLHGWVGIYLTRINRPFFPLPSKLYTPTSPPSTTHITPTPPPYHHNSSPSTFNPFIQSGFTRS